MSDETKMAFVVGGVVVMIFAIVSGCMLADTWVVQSHKLEAVRIQVNEGLEQRRDEHGREIWVKPESKP